MNIVIIVILIFALSFFWAYISLQKELGKAKKNHIEKEKRDDALREVVLFDRSKKG